MYKKKEAWCVQDRTFSEVQQDCYSNCLLSVMKTIFVEELS